MEEAVSCGKATPAHVPSCAAAAAAAAAAVAAASSSSLEEEEGGREGKVSSGGMGEGPKEEAGSTSSGRARGAPYWAISSSCDARRGVVGAM